MHYSLALQNNFTASLKIFFFICGDAYKFKA